MKTDLTKFMIHLLILIGIMGLGAASANIGDSKDKCRQRFGEEFGGGKPKNPAESSLMFIGIKSMKGVSVAADFWHGLSCYETYTKSEVLSDDDIVQMLKANADGFKWKKEINGIWTRSDGDVIAIAAATAKGERRLTILSKKFMDAADATAQQNFDFKNHPFFKHLIGEWISEGEIKSADGKVVKFKEAEKAEVSGGNTFIITTTHEVNGQATHDTLTITRKDSGIFKAVLQADPSKPVGYRYDVKLAEDGAWMEMTMMGNNNVKVTVLNTFKDGDHDTIECKTTITDGSGAAPFSKTNVCKRVKKP